MQSPPSNKYVIAGGRDYILTEADYKILDSLQIEEVVCGCATGADECGRQWAIRNNIPVKDFPADWKKLGRSAGPIRNQQMAKYADAVVLFPGGDGTASMYKEARKAKIKIYDFRNR